MLINLTPHTIDVFRREDVVPDFGRGFKLAAQNVEPAFIIPSHGIARVATAETDDGDVGGVPVLKQEYGAIMGLPKPRKGVYYIVSGLTAQAARAQGRTTDDLLLTTRLVRNDSGTIVGCAAFARP